MNYLKGRNTAAIINTSAKKNQLLALAPSTTMPVYYIFKSKVEKLNNFQNLCNRQLQHTQGNILFLCLVSFELYDENLSTLSGIKYNKSECIPIERVKIFFPDNFKLGGRR